MNQKKIKNQKENFLKRKQDVISDHLLTPTQRWYLKIRKEAEISLRIVARKDSRYLKKQKWKKKKRITRNAWYLNNLLKEAFNVITDLKKKAYFLKKYKHLLFKERTYTSFEKKLLSNIKDQKKLRQKRYASIVGYKFQKLHLFNKVNYFWNLFDAQRLKNKGSCSSVFWHSQKIYTLKKAFRFFYGYIKRKVWTQLFIKAKKKDNIVLNFLTNLENRLNVMLYRMNFVLSILQAKQLIRHGLIYVNDRCIKYINYALKKNDIISIDKKSFYKYVVLQNEIIGFSKMSLKLEIPYLYVKHRLLKGIILYDPKHNMELLFKQTPDFFFGSNEVQYEQINFYKETRSAKAFNAFVARKKAELAQKQKNTNPYLDMHRKMYLDLNTKIPIQNIRSVISFFVHL